MIEDKSQYGTYFGDSSSDDVYTETVPDGELWYIAEGFATGSGDRLKAGIRIDGTLIAFSNIGGTSGTGIGIYAPAGTEVVIQERDDGSDITYLVNIRRVL